MRYRSYSWVLILLFPAAALCVAGMNWITDPFGYFRAVDVVGFNSIKPREHAFERHTKSAIVTKMRPAAIIVGSSYSEVGLPAAHAGFTLGGTLAAYNLSLARAYDEEVYCYAMFALNQPGLKRLIVGGFGTKAVSCAAYSTLGQANYSKLLLSEAAFDASIYTLRHQSKQQFMTRDGGWSFKRFDNKHQDEAGVLASFFDDAHGYTCASPGSSFSADQIDLKPPPSDPSTAGLRKLIRLAQEKHVQLVFVDFPKHVFMNELLRTCGGLRSYWQWVWTVSAIIEQEVGIDLQRVQFWSFYGYNQINGEPLRNDLKMSDRQWQDGGHFNTEVGQRMLDAIYGGVIGYGYRPNTQQFLDLVHRSEKDRAAFVAANPWFKSEFSEFSGKLGLAQNASQP